MHVPERRVRNYTVNAYGYDLPASIVIQLLQPDLANQHIEQWRRMQSSSKREPAKAYKERRGLPTSTPLYVWTVVFILDRLRAPVTLFRSVSHHWETSQMAYRTISVWMAGTTTHCSYTLQAGLTVEFTIEMYWQIHFGQKCSCFGVLNRKHE